MLDCPSEITMPVMEKAVRFSHHVSSKTSIRAVNRPMWVVKFPRRGGLLHFHAKNWLRDNIQHDAFRVENASVYRIEEVIFPDESIALLFYMYATSIYSGYENA